MPACDAAAPDSVSQEKVEHVAPPTVPAEAAASFISFFEGLANAVRGNEGDCAAIALALNQHLDAHPGQIKIFHAMVMNKAPVWQVSPADQKKVDKARMDSLQLFQTQVERCAGNEEVLQASRRLLAPDKAKGSP